MFGNKNHLHHSTSSSSPSSLVPHTNVLQHLLKKAVEKFGERYSGWLKEHLNVVEELSSFLRPEVWDICKEVGKDGFTSEQ